MMTTKEFPLIAAAVATARAGYQQKSLSNVLEVLNTYTDSIPNPVYKDAKSALNTAVDVVTNFDGLYGEAFRAAYRYNDVDLNFMYAAHAAGKIKLAKKKKFDIAPIWFDVCAEIVTLHEALEALKSKVVKRAVRSDEERADDYVPPMPTTAAAKLVEDILKALTDGLTADYATYLHNSFVTDVEIYRPKTRAERMQMHYMPGFTETILMPLVGDNWDSFNGVYTTLKSDYKAILLKKAQSDADFAQRMFLYKNVLKLATIIERKDNFSKYTILEGRINSAGFQGEIVFEFADGSKFNVRNKVVAKYSVHNRPFFQFPTTFHFAVLPNGTIMKGQPSEEEMIEIFAVTKG
jgi:hypothetical protein